MVARSPARAKAEEDTGVSIYPTGAPNVPPSGPKLFISYRRADSASIAGRIYDQLAAYFGREALFKDVDSIIIAARGANIVFTNYRLARLP